MNMKIKVELGDVQKTLFMPVWARAVETQKNKPVIIDKTAVKIINSVKGNNESNGIYWQWKEKTFLQCLRKIFTEFTVCGLTFFASYCRVVSCECFLFFVSYTNDKYLYSNSAGILKRF